MPADAATGRGTRERFQFGPREPEQEHNNARAIELEEADLAGRFIAQDAVNDQSA